MLSPRFASERMSPQLEMVREVPPPPLVEGSRASREVTAVPVVGGLDEFDEALGVGLTSDSLDESGEHDGSFLFCSNGVDDGREVEVDLGCSPPSEMMHK